MVVRECAGLVLRIDRDPVAYILRGRGIGCVIQCFGGCRPAVSVGTCIEPLKLVMCGHAANFQASWVVGVAPANDHAPRVYCAQLRAVGFRGRDLQDRGEHIRQADIVLGSHAIEGDLSQYRVWSVQHTSNKLSSIFVADHDVIKRDVVNTVLDAIEDGEVSSVHRFGGQRGPLKPHEVGCSCLV